MSSRHRNTSVSSRLMHLSSGSVIPRYITFSPVNIHSQCIFSIFISRRLSIRLVLALVLISRLLGTVQQTYHRCASGQTTEGSRGKREETSQKGSQYPTCSGSGSRGRGRRRACVCHCECCHAQRIQRYLRAKFLKIPKHPSFMSAITFLTCIHCKKRADDVRKVRTYSES